ncbi:hypothetical protein N7G274_009089 [Stereocaulon virgatum]|uniref:UEV-domain-containing protein n=1 Tax=Stereocaulon virgatum TaxID=373712 RepID=A0ABR3ZWV6_9LECA
MQGTLPVSFRGTTYAFPISIWIPQEYPKAAPLGFITPTADMVVRPGQYVSGEGKIYHPYLAGWRDDRCSLSGFLSILQDIFTREPPVVAKQEQTPRQTQLSQQNNIPPPVPPLPPELEKQDQNARPVQPLGSQQPPPPPPKPFKTRDPTTARNDGPRPLPPLPTRPESQYGSARPISENGYTRDSQPMPRQAPQRTGSLQGGNISYQRAGSNSQYSSQSARHEPFSSISPLTRPNHSTGPIMFPTQSQYSQQGPPLSRPDDLISPKPPVYHDGQQQTSRPHTHQQPHPQHYQRQPYLSQQPSPQASRTKPPEDLLTSPFENPFPTQSTNIAAPPIPPNPQKDALLSALSQTLTQQIHATHASNLSALPPLRAQQAALTSTLNAINAEMSQLNDLEALLSSNEAILHQAMRDADKVLDDAKRRKVPNVDEVLVAPTVVAGQLYASVAEERAIEESRAVIGKALDKGRISGGVWAKQTRSLAREEFLKKALIKKISRGIGLVEDERWG